MGIVSVTVNQVFLESFLSFSGILVAVTVDNLTDLNLGPFCCDVALTHYAIT